MHFRIPRIESSEFTATCVYARFFAQRRAILMDERTQLTPMSRWRERLIRLTNDTAWGKRFAYWFGKTSGGLQLRLEKLRPSNEIPWTPLRRPIMQATVAVIATGGVHLCRDEQFDLKKEPSFRAIPRTASSAELCITHGAYDSRDASRDLNLIFPLERLLELETVGVIGRVADVHYGFGFVQDLRDLLALGRQVGKLFAQAGVRSQHRSLGCGRDLTCDRKPCFLTSPQRHV
jgi:D-proline reductase (dithiol) PrdB